MSDLISRQAAIDAVKRLSLGETDAMRLAMRIGDYLERLPSAQPEQRWIPCSERLPEDEGLVLAFGDEGLLIAEHYRFGDWVKFMLDKDGRYMSPYPTTIYYWMPLPEPPEVEDETD